MNKARDRLAQITESALTEQLLCTRHWAKSFTCSPPRSNYYDPTGERPLHPGGGIPCVRAPSPAGRNPGSLPKHWGRGSHVGGIVRSLSPGSDGGRPGSRLSLLLFRSPLGSRRSSAEAQPRSLWFPKGVFQPPFTPPPFQEGVTVSPEGPPALGGRPVPPAPALAAGPSRPGRIQTSALNSGRFTAGGWAARAPGRR